MDHARHEGQVDIDPIFTLESGRSFDTGLSCWNLFYFSVHGFKCVKSETPLECVKFMAHGNH